VLAAKELEAEAKRAKVDQEIREARLAMNSKNMAASFKASLNDSSKDNSDASFKKGGIPKLGSLRSLGNINTRYVPIFNERLHEWFYLILFLGSIAAVKKKKKKEKKQKKTSMTNSKEEEGEANVPESNVRSEHVNEIPNRSIEPTIISPQESSTTSHTNDSNTPHESHINVDDVELQQAEREKTMKPQNEQHSDNFTDDVVGLKEIKTSGLSSSSTTQTLTTTVSIPLKEREKELNESCLKFRFPPLPPDAVLIEQAG